MVTMAILPAEAEEEEVAEEELHLDHLPQHHYHRLHHHHQLALGFPLPRSSLNDLRPRQQPTSEARPTQTRGWTSFPTTRLPPSRKKRSTTDEMAPRERRPRRQTGSTSPRSLTRNLGKIFSPGIPGEMQLKISPGRERPNPLCPRKLLRIGSNENVEKENSSYERYEIEMTSSDEVKHESGEKDSKNGKPS